MARCVGRRVRRIRIAGAVVVALAAILLLQSCNDDKKPVAQVPSIASSMSAIQPDSFQMGSPTTEPGRQPDELPHDVALTRAFSLCDHEVSQSEWQGVMGSNPSFFGGGARPVDSVSWLSAVEFCNRLSAREGLAEVYTIRPDTVIWARDANGYRLPTEAEWEFACRAESTSAFCNGAILNANDDCQPDANLDRVGWYCANYSGSSHDVRSKAPNAWGLHDLHGNVWEWCWDWKADYAGADSLDPTGPQEIPEDSLRVLRGGSWGSHPRFCRSAARWGLSPRAAQNYIGLRVARNAGVVPGGSRRRAPTEP